MNDLWTWIRILWALILLGKKNTTSKTQRPHSIFWSLLVVVTFRWNPFANISSIGNPSSPGKVGGSTGCPNVDSVVFSLRLARRSTKRCQYSGFQELSLLDLLDWIIRWFNCLFISNWTFFLSISNFFVHDQAFSIAFNHRIITTRPLDYSREGTAFRSLILFHLQVFPDGDVKQHVPINITRQRDTWSVWECGS